MQPDKSVLILPSSVYAGAAYTVLLDPVERMQQYLDALSWYIRESAVQKIIICDNTGYEYPSTLHQLASVHNKEIELLSFKGDRDLAAKYGKGYGEGEILEFIMTHSQLIQKADGFLKVTGRLKLVNLNKILRRIDPSKNYFMPISLLRPRFLVPKAARTCVEVRAYYVTKKFFTEVLQTAYKNVRDDETFFLEHAYHEAIARNPQYIQQVKCFPLAPEITGVSGSNGWVFKERSRLKKILIRLVAHLGYIIPVYKASGPSDIKNAENAPGKDARPAP